MSQNIPSDINPNTTSGTQLATLLNGFKDAIASGFSGATRPTNLQAGGYWIDTALAAAPDYLWIYKLYTGTADIAIFTVNIDQDKVSFGGSEDTFEIYKISEDSSSPILNFKKSRETDNGQVVSGDYIGSIRFISNTNTPTTPTVARLRVIANEDHTSGAQGVSILIEGTKDTEASIAEWARWMNGNLGIGVATPTFALHTRSITGVKHERVEDSATGVRQVTMKKRVTSLGGVSSADILYSQEMNSTDDAGTEFTAVKIEAKAEVAHSPTDRFSSLIFSAISSASASLVEIFKIAGNKITTTVPFLAQLVEYSYQTVATSATITSLSSSSSLVVMTGSTATEIQGITATTGRAGVLIHNGSSASVSFVHLNGGASAANQLSLPKSKITIKPGESIEFFYDLTNTKWKLKSGSGGGSGGGGFDTAAVQAANKTYTVDDLNSLQKVTGATPIVLQMPSPSADIIGQGITFLRTDDPAGVADSVEIEAAFIGGDTETYLEFKHDVKRIICVSATEWGIF